MNFTFKRTIDPDSLQATVTLDATDLKDAFPEGDQPPEVDDLHYATMGRGWDPTNIPESLRRIAQVIDRAVAARAAAELGLVADPPEVKE